MEMLWKKVFSEQAFTESDSLITSEIIALWTHLSSPSSPKDLIFINGWDTNK